MTSGSIQKAVKAIALPLGLFLALGLSGCAPESTFTGLSDEQMTGLFPTEAEVAGIVPGDVNLSEPHTREKVTPSTAGASPALAGGVPENCRGSYFGTDETRSLNSSTTRSFEREAVAGERQLRWRLIQFPSPSEAKRSIETYRAIGEKCELISPIDLEVQTGFGQAVQSDGEYTVSTATIAVDDVVLAVTFSEFAQDEAEEAAKKMAAGMESRLKANRPK